MEPVSIGKSADSVYRVASADGSITYLKVGGKLIKQEYERLQWLQGRIPVAKIIAFEEHEGLYRLTTQAVHGIMAHECVLDQRDAVLRNIAKALRALHETPIDECPFDNTIEHQLAEAAANTKAGVVDEDDFDPKHLGMTAEQLLPQLIASKPAVFENVLTHGDYCVQNILIDPVTLEVNGFIDLGRFGISDRYLDLGIVLNTLDHYIGKGYEAVFFEAYGLKEVDWSRIRFYQMLDEFF